MIKNFFKTAWRNLIRSKAFSLINISGLAIGIASFILISWYVINEVSYDRFHSKAPHIFRVNTTSTTRGMSTDVATSHIPLAKTLISNYPEVAEATRLLSIGSLRVGLEKENEHYSEDKMLFADSNFFDVFSFKLLKGNPRTALVNPRSLVLTETIALKFFGDLDPIGRQIAIEDDTVSYLVTGVVADVPANSHIQFHMLGSLSTNVLWNDNRWIPGPYVHTYVVLRNNANVKALETKMREIVYKYLGPEIEYYSGLTMANWEKAGSRTGYYLIPLKDIHLRSTSNDELEPHGNISYIYIYALIALIILFIAIFNFINMATARSALRAKEVGVRKVIGSSKARLIYQFIFESVIVSIFATVIAGILVTLLRPWFEGLVGKRIDFSITSGYAGFLLLFGLAIVVGVLAGFYPAFVLSAFQPVKVLKGAFSKGGSSRWLRNFLVVAQFTASIVIIIGTIIVYEQLHFMLTKNLGFTKEQVLVIRRPDVLSGSLDAFKNDLLANPDIRSVARSNTIPGKPYPRRSYRRRGETESFLMEFNHVSYEYQKTMDLKVLSGRFFSKERGLDSQAVVINETAAKALGFDDPIGKQLTTPWHKGELMTIIGVVKDFNIESLRSKIELVALEMIPENENINGYVTVRVNTGANIRQTLKYIEDTWSRHSNGRLFESFFFDDDYENIYKSEFTAGNILVVFAGLSIFIACLGLVGLLAFTAFVRKKEIGIRKVLGAGIAKLINLLSADVVKLIVISTLIAWPIAYLGTQYWLRNFVDRVEFNPWVYLLASIVVLSIGGVAISFQVVKAALANPVKSLRTE